VSRSFRRVANNVKYANGSVGRRQHGVFLRFRNYTMQACVCAGKNYFLRRTVLNTFVRKVMVRLRKKPHGPVRYAVLAWSLAKPVT
jgi:hypothetical protein